MNSNPFASYVTVLQRLYALATLSLISLAGNAVAQTNTWDGGGGDDLFGTGANWVGDSAPSVGSGVVLQFDGSLRLGPVNNYGTGDNFGEWHLLNTAGGDFTITGSGFGLYGKVENDAGSGRLFTVNTAGIYARDGSLELNPVGGGLTIGGSIELDNNAQLDVWDGNSGNTLTLNGALSNGNGTGGNGSLVLNQTATVILGADNDYGGTTINSGTTLRVGSGGGTGTLGSGNTANNGALIFDRTGSLTYSGVLSGAGTVTNEGTGTLTLSGENTYSGATVLSAGTTKLGNAGAFGSSSAVTVGSGATLDLAGYSTGRPVTIAGAGVSGAALTNSSAAAAGGVGTLTLSADATMSGATSANTGAINTAGIFLGGNTLTLGVGRLTVDGSDIITNGNITATSGSVIYMNGNSSGPGSGTTMLNAGSTMDVRDHNNTEQASVRTISINGGELSNGGPTAPTPGNGGGAQSNLKNPITVATSGVLRGNNTTWGQNLVLSGAMTGSGTLTNNSTRGITLSGDLSGFSGTYVNTAGTTLFQNGANAISGTLRVHGGEVAIENTVANTFTAVVLNGGITRVKNNSNAFGTAGATIAANSTLATQSGSAAVTLGSGITFGTGALTLSLDSGYAGLNLGGTITGSGTDDTIKTTSSGTSTLSGTATLGTISVPGAQTLAIASPANVTVDNVNLSGNTTANILNVTGGTLSSKYFNLGNGGSTSGRITQSGGMIVASSGGYGVRIGHWNNNAISGSSWVVTGGTLDATALAANSGSARLINIGWDGAGTMSVGSGAGAAAVKAYGIQLDANGDSTSYNDTLTVSANGTVELGAGGIAGASVNDNIILNGGTLKATANGTWSALITNTAASILSANAGATGTISGTFAGTAGLTKAGAGTITLQGNKSFSGGVNVNEGTLYVNAGGWYLNPFGSANTVTVNAGGILRTAYAHSLGVDQNTIHINGGTLLLGAENYITSLQMTGGLVTNGELRTWGGTMTFNATPSSTEIASRLSLVGSGTLNVADGAGAVDLLVSGSIINGGSLTKSGAGTLQLTGTNTHTGATIVRTGTFALGGASLLTNTPSITVSNGATFDVSGVAGFTLWPNQTLLGNGTVNGVVQVNGTVAPGASIGTLTFNTPPTLAGTVLLEINQAAAQKADLLAVTSGTLNYGGNLVVTNIGPVVTNGTFTIFNAPGGYAGTFASLTLPAGGTAHWKTNNLVVDGTISFTNNNPVAQDFVAGAVHGGSVTLPITGGKFPPSDADGDSLSVTAVGTPSSGSASFTSSNVTYVASGTTGTNTFTYTVTDTVGGTDTKTVTVVVTSPQGFNQLSATFGAGNAYLSYLGIPGLNYALEVTHELPATNWTAVVTNAAAPNGLLNFTNPVSLAPTNDYYRTRHIP